MCLHHIQPLYPKFSRLYPLLPIPKVHVVFFFKPIDFNLCCPTTLGCIYWLLNLLSLTAVTLLKQTDSLPFPDSYQMLIIFHVMLRLHVCVILLPSARILFDLGLCMLSHITVSTHEQLQNPWVIECEEIKQAVTCKFCLYWLAFIVLEGGMCYTGWKKSISPSHEPYELQNDWPNKTGPLMQQG